MAIEVHFGNAIAIYNTETAEQRRDSTFAWDPLSNSPGSFL
jgi:hypothetical protein